MKADIDNMANFGTATLARLARRLNAGPLPPLVLMTDEERLPDPCAAAERLPRGSMIVLRARDDAQRVALARRLTSISRQRGLFFLVAGDPDLAARAGADGAHFPEKHAGEIAYWRARHTDWFITAAAHSLGAVARAWRFGADAAFLSPVFATKSHPGRAALTPIRLRAIAQRVPVAIYALGGIDAANVQRLAGARLAGIAAMGALTW